MRTFADGYEYEYQCAKMLKRKGFSKVRVTRASGDQGIDILASKEGKTYGIQCKYYSRPVGNKAVQEAFAGAKFYDCDVAAVLTNSTFTPSARSLAQKTGVILWEGNAVPRSVGFRVTKWIGVFLCMAGLLGLFAGKTSAIQKMPAPKQIYFGLMVAGGLFNFLECGFAWMELCACACYAVAAVLAVLLGTGEDSAFFNTLFILIAASALSLARAVSLKKRK